MSRQSRPTGYFVRASGESSVYKDHAYQYRAGWRAEPPPEPSETWLTPKRYNETHGIEGAQKFRTKIAAYERAREVRRYFGAWAAPTYHLIPFFYQADGTRRLGNPEEIKL